MARTVQQINEVILLKMNSTPALSVLTTVFSKVGIWVLFVDVISYCIWTLEVLFDSHRDELEIAFKNQKVLRTPWYKQLALNFQYGHNLILDTDQYDNTGYTDDQIEASKVVKYAAANAVEIEGRSKLLLKVAGETSGVLAPITTPQLSAFRDYIQKTKGAGTLVNIVNFLPDKLYLTIEIYYNPLVLDSSGLSILNGNKPVEDAITDFFTNKIDLPFDGELIIVKLQDKLQGVTGVDIPNIISVASSWIDVTVGDYGTPVPINVKKIPESGYFTIVDFVNITYIANV